MTEEQATRRAQILAAAFSEFAERGFRGATIKSIAAAADLKSPALIYWYFPTKEALFQAVLEERASFLRMAGDPAALLAVPPQVLLPQFARAYLGAVEQPDNQRMMRLIFAEMFQRQEAVAGLGNGLIQRVLVFLTTYLSHWVAQGQLRPHDVRASARAFMGLLMPQALGMLAFEALRADGLANEEHVATVIDLFLRGLQPTGA